MKEASEEQARLTAKITKTTSAPIVPQEISKITKKSEPTPVVRDLQEQAVIENSVDLISQSDRTIVSNTQIKSNLDAIMIQQQLTQKQWYPK